MRWSNQPLAPPRTSAKQYELESRKLRIRGIAQVCEERGRIVLSNRKAHTKIELQQPQTKLSRV